MDLGYEQHHGYQSNACLGHESLQHSNALGYGKDPEGHSSTLAVLHTKAPRHYEARRRCSVTKYSLETASAAAVVRSSTPGHACSLRQPTKRSLSAASNKGDRSSSSYVEDDVNAEDSATALVAQKNWSKKGRAFRKIRRALSSS